MAEYIEREAALSICQKEYEDCLKMHDYCGDSVAWNIGGAIKGLPAADVAPVVYGRWEPYQVECGNPFSALEGMLNLDGLTGSEFTR